MRDDRALDGHTLDQLDLHRPRPARLELDILAER